MNARKFALEVMDKWRYWKRVTMIKDIVVTPHRLARTVQAEGFLEL
jgi:hypothetical protein